MSGSLVNAGLVDEVSALILPLIDGRGGHPASFEYIPRAPSQLSCTECGVNLHPDSLKRHIARKHAASARRAGIRVVPPPGIAMDSAGNIPSIAGA